MKVGFENADTPSLDTVFRKDCPGRPVFEQVTSRWGLLILVALESGPLRFAQLRDRIGGISEKMLSQNLRSMVRNGLIERSVEPAAPPRVTYALTVLGGDLTGKLRVLVDWNAAHSEQIAAAQRDHDTTAAGSA
ncbi:winged helix-turn-helix transcriptional regulator [Nocardia asteroides]|uniref:winged helix-turn-helix transcriptional regulator n=1 Tax=Nocardia asteroides TaxID=1824 RepID=UPI001E47A0CD|nr:helix-turn-helix domain-containing protein [Nocardia asteroides]UGT55279.1 helix-turn-helix transcriptional regulator [Nocardia asteroides]